MKFVLLSITNKDKSTEIFPPLLLQPTYICACALCNGALPRTKKVSKRIQYFRRRQGFTPLARSYYSIELWVLAWLTGWWLSVYWWWICQTLPHSSAGSAPEQKLLNGLVTFRIVFHDHNWGEYNSHEFYNFCVGQFMYPSLFFCLIHAI